MTENESENKMITPAWICTDCGHEMLDNVDSWYCPDCGRFAHKRRSRC